MIDTHTHLYLPEFEGDRTEVVESALRSGVDHFVFPNVDLSTVSAMLDLQKEFPEKVSIAIGLHPTSVGENYESDLRLLRGFLSEYNCCAVGEVGIDLYWDKSHLKEQIEAFSEQLRWAWDEKLPVIIHSREALPEILGVIKEHRGELPKLIFHSFTGSRSDVKEIRKETDAYFGINGVVTFKNANELRDALHEIGMERIVLETDSPYLTPVPYRGKRNDSGKLVYVRDRIALEMGRSPEEVDSITTRNALELFKIKE